MLFEVLLNSRAQRAGALAVNDRHFGKSRHRHAVEEQVKRRKSFFDRQSAQITARIGRGGHAALRIAADNGIFRLLFFLLQKTQV